MHRNSAHRGRVTDYVDNQTHSGPANVSGSSGDSSRQGSGENLSSGGAESDADSSSELNPVRDGDAVRATRVMAALVFGAALFAAALGLWAGAMARPTLVGISAPLPSPSSSPLQGPSADAEDPVVVLVGESRQSRGSMERDGPDDRIDDGDEGAPLLGDGSAFTARHQHRPSRDPASAPRREVPPPAEAQRWPSLSRRWKELLFGRRERGHDMLDGDEDDAVHQTSPEGGSAEHRRAHAHSPSPCSAGAGGEASVHALTAPSTYSSPTPDRIPTANTSAALQTDLMNETTPLVWMTRSSGSRDTSPEVDQSPEHYRNPPGENPLRAAEELHEARASLRCEGQPRGDFSGDEHRDGVEKVAEHATCHAQAHPPRGLYYEPCQPVAAASAVATRLLPLATPPPAEPEVREAAPHRPSTPLDWENTALASAPLQLREHHASPAAVERRAEMHSGVPTDGAVGGAFRLDPEERSAGEEHVPTATTTNCTPALGCDSALGGYHNASLGQLALPDGSASADAELCGNDVIDPGDGAALDDDLAFYTVDEADFSLGTCVLGARKERRTPVVVFSGASSVGSHATTCLTVTTAETPPNFTATRSGTPSQSVPRTLSLPGATAERHASSGSSAAGNEAKRSVCRQSSPACSVDGLRPCEGTGGDATSDQRRFSSPKMQVHAPPSARDALDEHNDDDGGEVAAMPCYYYKEQVVLPPMAYTYTSGGLRRATQQHSVSPAVPAHTDIPDEERQYDVDSPGAHEKGERNASRGSGVSSPPVAINDGSDGDVQSELPHSGVAASVGAGPSPFLSGQERETLLRNRKWLFPLIEGAESL